MDATKNTPQAVALWQKMNEAYESGNVTEAMRLAACLPEAEDTPKEGLISAASIYIDNNMPEQGDAILAKIAARYGKDGVWYFFRARAEYLKKNYGQALRLAKKALAQKNLSPLRELMTHNILGRLYKEMGQVEEAARESLVAVCVPNNGADTEDMLRMRREEYSNYLLNLHYCPNIDRDGLLAAAKKYADFFPNITPFAHERRTHEKIRVGYISPDLRRHVVMDFAWAFFTDYDRTRFEVYAYYSGKEDATSRRIASLVDKWNNVRGLSCLETARKIYADEVDILVDLAGHTAFSLLPVLAYKPAPVQISGIGYFDTTGLPSVDYFLTDYYTDPQGLNDEFFTEKLLRHPFSHWCYSRDRGSDITVPLPYRKNGFITFGSFNNFSKIGDDVLRAWSAILAQVPASRLFLRTRIFDTDYGKKQAAKRLRAAKIDLSRVITEGFGEDYLPRYNEIDIALDPFPYPGGGTTCDALYMNVPVVTLVGERHNSRFGFSILKNLGLEELAAGSVEEYIAIAVRLAKDLPHLSELHQTLRRRMRQSPLMDAALYMTEFERLCENIAAGKVRDLPTRDYSARGKEYLSRAGKTNAKRAAYWLKKAVGENDTADNHYLLAQAYEKSGDFCDEYEELTKAAALYETDRPTDDVRRQLFCRLAYTSLYMGKAADAVEYYKCAVEMSDALLTKASLYGAMLLAAQNTAIGDEELFRLHCGFQKLFADVKQYAHEKRDLSAGRRVRIGYVSADFRRHVMFSFYYGIFVCHDRGKFEVFCYSVTDRPDGYTEQVKETVEHFTDAGMLDEKRLAEKIYADKIDILVDLSGHSAGNMLAAFAYKPAPVQISGIGYLATTGLAAMDYFITDAYADPPGNEKFLTEKPLFLPSQFCYAGRSDVPQPSAPPCEENGFVTFGVFNRYAKITDDMLYAWREIMERVQGSRLVLKSAAMNDDKTAQRAWQHLKNLGFDMDLVSLEPATDDYMERYGDIDIALDTYPYTGGGTTFDALYMGVPVVTRYGMRRNTRFGLGILANLRMTELAADNLRDYIEKAVSLAGDIELLAVLRRNLRPMLLKCAAFAPKNYTRQLEEKFLRLLGRGGSI